MDQWMGIVSSNEIFLDLLLLLLSTDECLLIGRSVRENIFVTVKFIIVNIWFSLIIGHDWRYCCPMYSGSPTLNVYFLTGYWFNSRARVNEMNNMKIRCKRILESHFWFSLSFNYDYITRWLCVSARDFLAWQKNTLTKSVTRLASQIRGRKTVTLFRIYLLTFVCTCVITCTRFVLKLYCFAELNGHSVDNLCTNCDIRDFIQVICFLNTPDRAKLNRNCL